MKFLLIEADDAVAEGAERRFAALSAELERTRHGDEAIARLEQAAFDCVLLDPSGPGGFDLVERLQAAGHAGPIIAVTDSSRPDDRERVLRAGFDHCVVKPYTRDLVRQLVRWVSHAPMYSHLEREQSLRSLISIFVEELRHDIGDLYEALRQEDFDRLERLVAGLRSQAEAPGLEPVAAVADELERMVHARSQPRRLKEQLDELVGLCMWARPASRG